VRPGLVLQNDVQSVDDTGNVTQNGEEDVDEEVGTTATLEEDTHGREDDGKEDLADVAEANVSPCLDAFNLVSIFSTARQVHPKISCDSRNCGSLGMTSSLKSRILEGIALPSSERHVVGF
jgi:hypothetical protein